MEYENGILALEFAAPNAARSFSISPASPPARSSPEANPRLRLGRNHQTRAPPHPAGKGAGNRVRIGLAIEAPDATAFFDSARVLLIGETNNLIAQFSSDAILQRSRLRAAPELHITQTRQRRPAQKRLPHRVPDTVIHGDRTELALEADGARMSHANPEYMRPSRSASPMPSQFRSARAPPCRSTLRRSR